MSVEDNAATFRRFMVEAFQGGNLAVVDELLSPDLIDHQFGLQGTGAQAIAKVKRAITDLHGWLSDLHYTFDDMTSDGDVVWARMTCRGTNTGPVFGRPATGREIEITVVDVSRFKNGQIAEHWGVPDRFALLAQLGLLDELLKH